MNTKIAIKSDSVTPVGGTFYAMDEFCRLGEDSLIDKSYDFGWSHLPCSFLGENTAFLLLTAMAKNFYTFLPKKIAAVFDDLEQGSRVKRFIFRFITVPAKWIKSGRRWVLKFYSDKPYKLLWSP